MFEPNTGIFFRNKEQGFAVTLETAYVFCVICFMAASYRAAIAVFCSFVNIEVYLSIYYTSKLSNIFNLFTLSTSDFILSTLNFFTMRDARVLTVFSAVKRSFAI